MRFRFAFAALLMLAAAPVPADTPTVKSICEESPTLAVQRERLAGLAKEAEGTPASADAWLALGRNYEYEGAADSALACYRRAIDRRGEPNELIRAADVLLRRSGTGDAQEALGYVERTMSAGPTEGASPQLIRARLAWAHFLLGRTDQASTMFTRMERSLYRDPLWMLRMGQVALEHGDPVKAYGFLYAAAILSRGQSDDAMQLIAKVADHMGVANRADDQIFYEIAVRDRRHDTFLKSLGARRVKFSGSGSFPLGGTLFEPAGKGSHPAIVALIAPDDSLYSWDSLGVRLRDAGFATLFVDGRGSGWSVGRSTPLPAAWNDQRGALVEATAHDVREAFRALKLSTKTDTTRYTLMTSATMAMPALLAAERDPRIQSLVLFSPNLSMVERGPAREIMKRIQVPLYATETTIDRLNALWIDPLFQAAPPGISRVGSPSGAGTGPETLRHDPANTARLIEWLKEKRPPRPAAARSTRRG